MPQRAGECDARPVTATKIDLKRERAELYAARADPRLLTVPELAFLAVDGSGDPRGADFQAALETLYPVAYALKFRIRAAHGLDYTVLPLEALFWADDPTAFAADERAAWRWTALIPRPPEAQPNLVDEAVAKASARRALPARSLLRLERLEEGRCAQVLHVGPYDAEGPTIERLHAFIAAQGLALVGKHHEVYLGDPRRTPPERLRTIVRQPVTDLRRG
jgi:hypothetical protein